LRSTIPRKTASPTPAAIVTSPLIFCDSRRWRAAIRSSSRNISSMAPLLVPGESAIFRNVSCR
jgi:hypothetical protein